jgi:hypothetical protein
MVKSRGIFILVILALICTRAFPQTPTPVLVELFTSEGCSSCPPADALLRTLDSSQPVSGAQLIVLGEHVDYWDDLGWKDEYSDHAFTVRQQNYAERLGLASTYTPQMVVDGSFDVLGSDRQRVNQTFEKARSRAKVSVRISSLKLENGVVSAHVEVDAVPSKAEVFVALALDHAESQVLRGENGGHRLQHVAVARSLVNLGKAAKGEAFAKDVRLNAKPSDAGYRLLAFTQEANQGKVLGAAVQLVQK